MGVADELSCGASVAGALVLALALAALHVAAPHLRRLPGVAERATGSFAGGLAVAYVLLHLLPVLYAIAGVCALIGALAILPVKGVR